MHPIYAHRNFLFFRDEDDSMPAGDADMTIRKVVLGGSTGSRLDSLGPLHVGLHV